MPPIPPQPKKGRRTQTLLLIVSFVMLLLSISILALSVSSSDTVLRVRNDLLLRTANYSPGTSIALNACGSVSVAAACMGIISAGNGLRKVQGNMAEENESIDRRLKTQRKIDIFTLFLALISTLVSLIVSVYVSVAFSSSSQIASAISVAISPLDQSTPQKYISVEVYACQLSTLKLPYDKMLKDACSDAGHARRMAIVICVASALQAFLVWRLMVSRKPKPLASQIEAGQGTVGENGQAPAAVPVQAQAVTNNAQANNAATASASV